MRILTRVIGYIGGFLAFSTVVHGLRYMSAASGDVISVWGIASIIAVGCVVSATYVAGR